MKAKPQEKNKKSAEHLTQQHWHEMNRKQRRETMRKMESQELSLEVVHPGAAGIDIGNEFHYVAVPPSRDGQPVRRFGCTTAELKAMADWLKHCEIRTIAMQSTGVYWIAVFDILEQAGLEVYLVNARDTKNLPGRKSDVQESQWLMKLHTYGLLRNSFRPVQEIRTMRTYWRQRNDLVQSAGRHIQRMQKAMTQMNIQLANVLSDVSGTTGQAIITAILRGERDPHKLAELRDPHVKASEEQIAQVWKATGNQICCLCSNRSRMAMSSARSRWRSAIGSSRSISNRERIAARVCPSAGREAQGTPQEKERNAPQFDLREGLFRLTGTDLTRIDSIDVMTATTIVSEAGYDMSKWETEHHFVSWLRLGPDNRISGQRSLAKAGCPPIIPSVSR